MKILHLNTYDTTGGAARAAYRLHHGLRSQGIDSRMLVQYKNSTEPSIHGQTGRVGKIYSRIRNKLDQIPAKWYSNRESATFSPAWLPEQRIRQIERHNPDIIHLHWINKGFFKLETISDLNATVVWTFHDMWPFTGGCHYTKSCTKYETECGACPHLDSNQQHDLANKIWNRKQKAWDPSDFVIVTPSQWLAKQTKESGLLNEYQIEVIPNGLDLNVFRPRERAKGIQRFNLNGNMHYILFGSAYKTSRKGGNLLQQALKHIRGRENIVALTFGGASHKDDEFPIPVRHLGRLSDEDLRLVYSTADLTVIPSREDNLPNIAVESLASGTPCVAFDIGGLPDIIDQGDTGYLAKPFDTEDLSNGISWVLSNPDRLEQLSKQARNVAEQRFSIETVANEYLKLYSKL